MSRQYALVEPALLRWARESAALETRAVASKLKLEEMTVKGWEDGSERITLAALKKLAAIYKRPLTVFFLPEPPTDFDALRDFRRIVDADVAASPALALEIRRANERREAALEMMSALGDAQPPFSLRALESEPIVMVASRLREALGVAVSVQRSWNNEFAALRAWKSSVERMGILVCQTVKLPVTTARGFSLVHEVLPVIVVNAADAAHARIFTLLHELVHVALRNGGVCDLHEDAVGAEHRVETFCNRVAGEVLLPREDLICDYNIVQRDVQSTLDETVRRLSTTWRVSSEVVLRALTLYGAVPVREYDARRDSYLARPLERKKSKAKVDFARRALNWAGYRFTRLAFAALDDDAINLADATGYLGVKTKQLPKMRIELAKIDSSVGQ